jgi:hypothetical protein
LNAINCVTKRPVAAIAAAIIMTMIAEFHQSTVPLRLSTRALSDRISSTFSPLRLTGIGVLSYCFGGVAQICRDATETGSLCLAL